jgi:peroxiredoxin Q/BCP
MESFGKRNAQVLGVSGDSLETHRSFANQHGIDFPLLDDSDGAIRKLYGDGRITYLVDQHGVIRLVSKGVPDNDQLLQALDTLNK